MLKEFFFTWNSSQQEIQGSVCFKEVNFEKVVKGRMGRVVYFFGGGKKLQNGVYPPLISPAASAAILKCLIL